MAGNVSLICSDTGQHTTWQRMLGERGYGVNRIHPAEPEPSQGIDAPALIVIDTDGQPPAQTLAAIQTIRETYPDVATLVVANPQIPNRCILDADATVCAGRPGRLDELSPLVDTMVSTNPQCPGGGGRE